ncbi:MAG: KUP/HAK/KT family potassium transporter [Candidatus Methylacidiphilales bacterium]|nr:KUP/HAK/KT family potassium transporter [Candidatus Methylacidiphilales bacterium]
MSTRENRLWAVALASTGVVFGDIGTSPLYTIRECFGLHHVPATHANVLGVLSLIFWSLTVIVSVKYTLLLCRADNQGEGGVFALSSLLSGIRDRLHPRLLWAVGLMALVGAALLYGDGMITPAISVLAAVEGLKLVSPVFEPWIVPLAVGILFLLFFIQNHGSARIGFIFGPIMVGWFVTLAILGWIQVIQEPGIFRALNPWHAVHFLFTQGTVSLMVLGAVLLCVTGGEALYADIGHFGRKPLQAAWFSLVYPSLLMNYLGQGALIMRDPSAVEHPFYRMVPQFALVPMVLLATLATVIASQAMITGVFSLTQQAVQLGVLPRLRVLHTSDRVRGQIYMPGVNFILMLSCIGLVLAFRSSSNLAAAYGLSVTFGMVISTLLFALVMWKLWKWHPAGVAALTALFLAFELPFASSCLLKMHDGAWIPLATTILLLTVMLTWQQGREYLGRRIRENLFPIELLLKEIADGRILRVPGTGVFMSSISQQVPPVLVHHLKHNKALHERVILLTVQFAEEPRVFASGRARVEELAPSFHRVVLHYGFAEEPRVMDDLTAALDLSPGQRTGISFYQSREVLRITPKPGMSVWGKKLFNFIARTTRPAVGYFDLPPGQVIELGIQIEL